MKYLLVLTFSVILVTQAHADVFLSKLARLGSVRAIKKMDVSTKVKDFHMALNKSKKLANEQLRDRKTPWNNGFIQSDIPFIKTRLSDDSILEVSVLTEIKKSSSNQKLSEKTGISVLTNTQDKDIFNDIIEIFAAQGKAIKAYTPEGASSEFRMLNIVFEDQAGNSALNASNRLGMINKLEALILKLNSQTLGKKSETILTRSRINLRESVR